MGGARPLLARRPRIHHDPRRAAVAPRPAPHPARTTHPAATHQPTSRRRTRRRRGRGLTSTPTEDLYAASITPLVRRHPAQHLYPTRPADAAADLHAVHLTALADNALALAQTTGLTRHDLLLDRAQLWEQLASCSTPACAQAYRAVGAVCRQEAHLLMTGIDP